ETTTDPRIHALAPTQEEVDAWAEREHARRQAWIGGPTELEKQEWARRCERRAAFGFGESDLAPTKDEIDAWAERERRRRAAWLEGPSEDEKRRHASAHAVREGSELAPAPDEIEEWVKRETGRRRAWLEGPTEDEKLEWSRHQTEGHLFSGRVPLPPGLAREEARLASLLREVELAGKDTVEALSRVSGAFFSYFVRSRLPIEKRTSASPRRSRVPY
ncbi:MAG TPA: hypothetical protein VMS55_18815, partial [Myxococcota bacterium]|nr:hypothetical protein [Myxococcota bacterium]